MILFYRRLESFPLSDVADKSDGQPALCSIDATEADLNGKQSAIFAATTEIETRTHGPTSWVSKKISVVRAMMPPDILGDQYINRLP
jgi:hypothetical protein